MFVLSSLCLCCFLITVAFSHKWRSSSEAVLLIHRRTVWDIDQNSAFLFTDVVLNLLSQKSPALCCWTFLPLSLCWILHVQTWTVPFAKVPTSWSCASYMSLTPYQNIPRNSLDPPQAIHFLTGCCRRKSRCWSQITHTLQSDWELGCCIAEAYVWVTDYRGNDSCKKGEKVSAATQPVTKFYVSLALLAFLTSLLERNLFSKLFPLRCFYCKIKYKAIRIFLVRKIWGEPKNTTEYST